MLIQLKIWNLLLGKQGYKTIKTDKIFPKNGQVSGAQGGIIQIVSQTFSTQATSTSTSWSSTGLEATITPQSASNKILIQVSGPMTGFAGGSGDQRGGLKIYRGGSGGTSVESSSNGLSCQYGIPSQYSDVHILFLDSPATTSATTYTVMMSRRSGDTTYSFIRDGNQTGSIILMEVSA